jgi:hypothetical protein
MTRGSSIRGFIRGRLFLRGSSLCEGGWVSPCGRRRAEPVEAWRGCLKACWRRRSVSPLCPLDISPKCDDSAVEFGGEYGIEIFYEN